MSGLHSILLTASLKQLPEGIIIVDNEDRIVFVNRKAEDVRCVEAKDILGEGVRRCHPTKSAGRVERALNHIRKKRDAVFTRMVTDRIRERTYENTYAGLVDDDGRYLGLLLLTKRAIQNASLKWRHAQHVRGAVPKTSELALAGQLHDIGKVAIRTEVLNKPEPLEEHERNHIREHPVAGAHILSPVMKLSGVIAAVQHHHERFDGEGYPDRLAGSDIPEKARALAIADAYDAMTSSRPYRRALDPELAAKEI